MARPRLTRTHELRWHVTYHGADADALRRLHQLFQTLNARHFGGSLPMLPVRLSGRMRTRLGHITLERGTQRPLAITISRAHVAAHDWRDVEETLLHEMVHLWQSASGHPVDHGPLFRAKAREVGVVPAARRRLPRID